MIIGKPLPADAPLERQHAKTLSDGISARGYVISTVQEGALTFAFKPAVHLTAQSADLEIERLAMLNPGVKFVKLRIEGALTVGAVWE